MRRYCYHCQRPTPHDWYVNRRGDLVHECTECCHANQVETEDYRLENGRQSRDHRRALGATLRKAVPA
jgi:hypothetical protein